MRGKVENRMIDAFAKRQVSYVSVTSLRALQQNVPKLHNFS